jgi:hypothetical protein
MTRRTRLLFRGCEYLHRPRYRLIAQMLQDAELDDPGGAMDSQAEGDQDVLA